jgi:hypothetical protein
VLPPEATMLGPEILIEFAEFLAALFVALAECAQWSLIQKSLDYKKTRLAGVINEVYSKNIVVANVENATFTVGDLVYLRGDNYCYSAKIMSLQENDVDVATRTVLSPVELGLRFDSEPRKAAEIYYVNPEAPKNAPEPAATPDYLQSAPGASQPVASN